MSTYYFISLWWVLFDRIMITLTNFLRFLLHRFKLASFLFKKNYVMDILKHVIILNNKQCCTHVDSESRLDTYSNLLYEDTLYMILVGSFLNFTFTFSYPPYLAFWSAFLIMHMVFKTMAYNFTSYKYPSSSNCPININIHLRSWMHLTFLVSNLRQEMSWWEHPQRHNIKNVIIC